MFSFIENKCHGIASLEPYFPVAGIAHCQNALSARYLEETDIIGSGEGGPG
jgi:hypothetical protein